MSSGTCRTAPAGHRALVGGPGAGRLSTRLPGPDTYLPGAQRGVSGICAQTRREGRCSVLGPLLNFSKFG